MEIVGLAFGAASLVGLYSACMEAVDHIASYRDFGRDKNQLLARLGANKDIFQKWAKRVGISAEGLLVPHDTRLDDSNTAKAVSQILTCIQELLGDSSKAKHRPYQNQNQNTLSAPKRLCEPTVQSEPQAPLRRRDKLAWTFHGKKNLESQVVEFARLVKTLDRLVPPYGSSDGKDPNHQLDLTNVKDSLPWEVSVFEGYKNVTEFSHLLVDHNILQRQRGKSQLSLSDSAIDTL